MMLRWLRLETSVMAVCSFCQHSNPLNSKFCNACGAPLYVVACAQCGALNEVTASACHRCAGKLEGPADLTAPPSARVHASGASSEVSEVDESNTLPGSLTSEDRVPDPQAFFTLQWSLLDRSDPGATIGSSVEETLPPRVPHGARDSAERDYARARQYPVSAIA